MSKNVSKPTSGALHGDVKVWLEVRLGLLGAVLYDGTTAAAAVLIFHLLNVMVKDFWPDGDILPETLLFLGHWSFVILYAVFAMLDVARQTIGKVGDIMTAWREFKQR